MNVRFLLGVTAGKLLEWILRHIVGSSGSTWPGEIALRICPHILTVFGTQGKTTILIGGTNGKTTTAKMIETIVGKSGISVQKNDSGANLDNGIVSCFLASSTVSGRLTKEVFVFEVDEATLPKVVSTLHPTIVVLLNLFRDQLDRYGEVDTVASLWMEVFSKAPQSLHLIGNADDPHIAFIASQTRAHVSYFGLGDSSLYATHHDHAVDTVYCPSCGTRLTFAGVYFSHLGNWKCGKCQFTHPMLDARACDVEVPVPGLHNIYNGLGAVLVGRVLELRNEQIQSGISAFTPAFGRMEQLEVAGKKVTILLSKNPVGFNVSLRTALSGTEKKSLLLVLNDRIPDGRDVSWIWDVDFEMLTSPEIQKSRPGMKLLVAGDRCYDLAVRLKYAGLTLPDTHIFTDLPQAIHQGLRGVGGDDELWILPTYSAMLEVRRELTGRKIL